MLEIEIFIVILRYTNYTNELGLTKTEYYSEAQIELASVLKVLGHPARVAIIQSIIKSDSCICGDLVTEIGLAQATISQHLKELKSIGLIQGTIEGTSMCYCLNKERWSDLKQMLIPLLEAPNCTNDNCC